LFRGGAGPVISGTGQFVIGEDSRGEPRGIHQIGLRLIVI